MFIPLSAWTTDPTVHSRPPLYEETVLEDMIKEQYPNQSDKEIELLPILQKLDGLTSDTKLLMAKLKQMENSVKELKKGILEE